MKLFIFERKMEYADDLLKRINDWVNLHKEITVVDYDFGYDEAGKLQTVMVKWK